MTGGIARAGASAAAALLAVSLSACASVPSGGPVVQGAGGNNASDLYGSYVRMLPDGPQPGVGEEGLVRGFLKGVGSFAEDHGVAREYLTPARQSDWSPNGTVLVYEDMDAVVLDTRTNEDDTAATVRMRSNRVATIDQSGQYLPAKEGELIDATFELARDGEGEWRIAELPDELILSRSDVDLAYRPLNLYYFNHDHSTLVPDPVFLPVGTENVATRLVTMLVKGPTDWLAPAVDTSFSAGTRANVDYGSGTVTVELNSAGKSAKDHFGMGAQLVWTLKQLPEVEVLALRVGGEEVDISGDAGENLLSNGDWESVNPAGVTRELDAYFVRDGQLWSLDSSDQGQQPSESRVQGAPGAGATLLEQHAVSLDEDRVAGITAEGKKIVHAETNEGSQYSTVLSGGDYTALSWDGYGNLWVAEDLSEDAETEGGDSVDDDTERGSDPQDGDSDGDDSDESEAEQDLGTRLWTLREGTDPVEVDVPELRDTRVTRLRLSRDGTRLAVVTEDGDGRGRLSVSRVVHRDDDVSVAGFLPLARELEAVSDVSWRGGDQLAVIGHKENGAGQGYLVSLDGSTETTSAGAPSGADMVTITAAPGRPLLSSVEDDQIWMTDDRISWQRAADGTNPVYPG